MSIHHSSIAKKGNTAIAKHINQPGHNATQDMEISIMDTTPDTSQNPSKITEASWIAT
jgi:hypothetical protein